MARVQLHTLYSPAPVPCGFTHVNTRLHLAGRSARGGGVGGPGGGGGGGRDGRWRRRRCAPLSVRAPGRTEAGRTPCARKTGGGGAASGPPARFRRPDAALALPPRPPPHHHPPHRPSALGLFHWRTLPKMVICVRGRECGFPSFRVTWRERDSLAGARASLGLPQFQRPGKGRGAGPREWPRGPRRRVSQKYRSPEERDGRLSETPPRGREPGAQSRSQGGRGRARSAAPRGAAGALGAQGTRAAVRPGLGEVRRRRAEPPCFSLRG